MGRGNIAGLEAATGEALELEGKADLVLDSNVLLQIYSCHDLFETFEEAHARVGDAAVNDGNVVARLERLRDAFHFAMRCHEDKTRSIILPNEGLKILQLKAPPDDAGSFEGAFVRFVLYFLKDKVLSAWQVLGADPKQPKSGNAADDYLLALAEANDLPLVTDEGNAPGGPYETYQKGKNKGKRNLRGKAKARGVDVYTPGQWWRRPGFDATVSGPVFASRFNTEREAYVAERAGVPGANKVIQHASWIIEAVMNGRV